jgi:hypothetical protein
MTDTDEQDAKPKDAKQRDFEDPNSMPAANQAQTEPMPTSDHESAPSSGTVGSGDPQAQ